MKSRIIAWLMLSLFCLTNIGVVVRAHTCLISNKTVFALFSAPKNVDCCVGSMRYSEPGSDSKGGCNIQCGAEKVRNSDCSTLSTTVENRTDECCATANNTGTDSDFILKSVSKECISGCIADCTEPGITESCCRVSQVVLLDLHLRSLPESIVNLGLAHGLIPSFHVVSQGFSTENLQPLTTSFPVFYLKSKSAASRLQVWRL